MSEAVDAGVSAPAGEVLSEQVEAPRPVEVKPEAPEPAKPEAKKAPDAARSDAVKSAIEKTLEPKKAEEPKAEKVEEAKPEAKAERGPDGKFKGTEKPQEEAEKVQAEAPKPRPSAHKDAPGRFDDAAKAEWDTIPENSRGAIHRMQRELETGIQKYKASAEEFESVREYADMAKQSGTDLKTALSRYVAIENELRRDPIAGLQAVVANLGIKLPNGQPATLRDFASFILGQKPDQAASRQEATIAGLRQQIEGLTSQLKSVGEFVATSRQEAHASSIQMEWDNFRTANPNAGRLEAEMSEFLTKYPAADTLPVRDRLADALAWAEARYPEKIAAHTRVDDVAAQTRDLAARPVNPAGQKSISGAPSGNSQTIPQKLSRKEATARAIRAAGL